MTHSTHDHLTRASQLLPAGEYRVHTSCSFRRVSAYVDGSYRQDGDVLHGQVHRDGHPDLSMGEEKLEALVAFVNAWRAGKLMAADDPRIRRLVELATGLLDRAAAGDVSLTHDSAALRDAILPFDLKASAAMAPPGRVGRMSTPEVGTVRSLADLRRLVREHRLGHVNPYAPNHWTVRIYGHRHVLSTIAGEMILVPDGGRSFSALRVTAILIREAWKATGNRAVMLHSGEHAMPLTPVGIFQRIADMDEFKDAGATRAVMLLREIEGLEDEMSLDDTMPLRLI